MDTKPVDLLTPILNGGIHNTNFFNGRLLSAEDMQREQQANRLQHQQLGQAIGEGVAYGLEVTRKDVGSEQGKPSRVVSVKKGMAINRHGQALYLADDTDITLIRKEEAAAEVAGLFTSCEKLNTAEILTGTGIYLLVISPASGYEGMAPASGLVGDLNARGGCRRRDTVEGVQFRLVEVRLTSKNTSPETLSLVNELQGKIAAGVGKQMNLSKLRNVLAHLCFGTEDIAGIVADPLNAANGTAYPDGYGLIDKLRTTESPDLTGCDVPLGLIYWTTNGIEFVDNWSVRRKVIQPSCKLLWNQKRLAESEAVFLQFQEQIAEITDQKRAVEATFWLRYLPPAGIVVIDPALVENYMRSSGSVFFDSIEKSSGLDPSTFFKSFTTRSPVFLECAAIGPLIQESFYFAPLDLQRSEKEFVWLYLICENAAALSRSKTTTGFLVFASHHMLYRGNARVDCSRWNFANYAFI